MGKQAKVRKRLQPLMSYSRNKKLVSLIEKRFGGVRTMMGEAPADVWTTARIKKRQRDIVKAVSDARGMKFERLFEEVVEVGMKALNILVDKIPPQKKIIR